MKRIWIMLLAVTVALAMALPAMAGKPVKPPKPPRAALVVHLDAEPVWVHEGNDDVQYTVTLTNKTSAEISGITVELSAGTETNVTRHVVVSGKQSGALDYSWPISMFPEAAVCLADQQECELTASVTVTYDGGEVAATTSTKLMPYSPCDLVAGTAEVDGVCIWTTEPGIWEVSLEPTPPKNLRRQFTASVSVRDHVPGNWCTLPDGSGGIISGQWRRYDSTIVLNGYVYLPGVENPELEEGQCLKGGISGTDHFPIGNPNAFYLVAHGMVTVTQQQQP